MQTRAARRVVARAIRWLLSGVIVVVLANAAHAQPAALYKDGKKVIDFGEVTTPMVPGQGAMSRADTPGARFLERAFGKVPPKRLAAQRNYVQRVEECRTLVDGLLGDEVHSLVEGGDGLKPLVDMLEPLRAAHEANLARFAETAAILRNSGLGLERLARHAAIAEKYRAQGAQLVDRMTRLEAAYRYGNGADARNQLVELDRLLPKAGPRVSSPPTSPTRAPVLRMEAQAPEIVDPALARASHPIEYESGPGRAISVDPADLAQTLDVKFTPEIVGLANQLGHSPARMYEYIRNNVGFECYLGSRKGSGQTLEHMKGNDYDQASLLIALLRTSGIPARYVKGRLQITGQQLDDWLGFSDRYSAAVLLNTAGFAVTIYGSAGNVTAITLDRVWVEAWVPFLNYRGAVNDSLAFGWVPIDPVIKQYQYSQPFYVYGELGLNAEQFVQNYYSALHVDTPVQALEQVMLTTLGTNHPGSNYGDMIQSRSIVAETDGILPGTLPAQLLSVASRFSTIPTNLRYQVRFHVYGGADLDYTTSLPELSSKQITLSYVGATPADQQMIDNAGGIWFLPDPWMVDLVPVLKVDGCEVARGTGAITTGYYQNFDMQFTSPTGTSNQLPVVQNYLLAGNYDGLGIDPEDVMPALLDIPATACGEEYMGQVVHQAALAYLDNVDTADDSLIALMHFGLTNDVSEAIVENTITVWTDFFGNPVELEWTGMLVDADRKILGPVSHHGYAIACDFMRIGGADGSVQEHRLFETVFGEEAISTIKILGLASTTGIGVCKITSNIAAECPGMSQYPEVVNAINSYLAAGYDVIVPKAPLTYFNWTGTAWIAIDPATCAAGYIIYGGQSSMRQAGGGATVQTWPVPYSQLQCLNPSGTITVDPPGDYYCADNTSRWTFTVNGLKYIGRNGQGVACQELNQENKEFKVTKTIQQIAEEPGLGPGEYVFKVNTPTRCASCVPKEKRVTIFKVVVRDGGNAIKKDDLVYIGDTPQMPQLSASLEPTSLPGNAQWRMSIEYTRNRSDLSSFPSSGLTTVAASSNWGIANAIGGAFRGGKATVHCEYASVPCDLVFHIRGINPPVATAESEIGPSPWYAKPIAKWEGDASGQGRFYAQFNTIGSLGPKTTDIQACPNFGGPNGWGIFQLDNPNPTADQLWNWKANIAAAKILLNAYRTEATNWITAQEQQQQAEEPTMPLANYVFPFNGVNFQKGTARTPIDACTIQRYNGAPSWVIFWKNKTQTTPGSWEINAAQRAYVDNVCGQLP